MSPTAMIADDEQLVAEHLRSRLLKIWPELKIAGVATNGCEALTCIERERPDIAFLDIKMPGLTGLEVAECVAGVTRVVFVTAYDQYAVEAFEREAIDYILKPISSERLEQTVQRLRQQVQSPFDAPCVQSLVAELRATLQVPEPEQLRWIRASLGETVRLFPAEEVQYFRAEDKYTVVATRDGELLIRRTIKELAEQLDANRFWQIHRSTIVNVSEIGTVSRDFRGGLSLKLKFSEKELSISRSYAHLFRQM